eukprot:s8605_g4.t1
MEEESELDRLLELEREVFSEGEEKKHGLWCGRKWKSSMISVKSSGKGAETCSQWDPSAFPIKTKANLIEAINRKLQR